MLYVFNWIARQQYLGGTFTNALFRRSKNALNQSVLTVCNKHLIAGRSAPKGNQPADANTKQHLQGQ
jgi:hypothetical protein